MSIEHKYLYNGSLCTLDELHAAGVLLGTSQPMEATVWDVSDPTTQGTRYTSAADGIIVKSEGDIHYYATQSACDAEWTTEEPSSALVAYTSIGKTATSTSCPTIGGYYDCAPESLDTYRDGKSSQEFYLYDCTASGNKIPYDTDKTYNAITMYQGENPSSAIANGNAFYWNKASGSPQTVIFLVNRNGYLAYSTCQFKNRSSSTYTSYIDIVKFEYTAT